MRSRKERLLNYLVTTLILAAILGSLAFAFYRIDQTTVRTPAVRTGTVRDPDLERQDAEWEWNERDPLTRGG